MGVGLSLHIGINYPGPEFYPPGFTDLQSAERSALALEDLARHAGFWTKHLLTQEVLADHVLGQIELAASFLRTGDIFLLTYAGHGSQIPDPTGDEDDNGVDETWVAYDRMIADDELLVLWSRFQPGVRILVISDSCHSGTISSLLTAEILADQVVGPELSNARDVPAELPVSIALPVYEKNKAVYDAAQEQSHGLLVKSTVLSLSACQDDQITTYDVVKGGAFTNVLLRAWGNGSFRGNYRQFFQALSRDYQTDKRNPNFRVIGRISYSFGDQRPFTI